MKYSPYIAWAKEKHDISFNLGRSGVPGKPLAQLIENPLQALESGNHEDGWPPLMERIGERYQVSGNHITLTHGASMANHLVFALLLNPGDHALVEQPVYEPLGLLPEYFNAGLDTFKRHPERGYQPDPEDIEELIRPATKLIVLTDLHNPSGAFLNRSILRKIIALAEQNDCRVLIDEVYLEFLYPQGERTSALLSPAVITTRSLTKAFGLDDVRMGWIIADESTTEKLRRLRDLFSITTAFPSERLAYAALDHADDLLNETLNLLHKNKKIVEQFISRQPLLSWNPPRTGTVGFVKLDSLEVNRLVELLEMKYQTLVTPGRFFKMSDHFRIGWGMETDALKEGLYRFDQALKQLQH